MAHTDGPHPENPTDAPEPVMDRWRPRYVTGDATQPITHPAIVAHVCNDAGRWGRGFVLALSRRWPSAERAYRNWWTDRAALVRDQPFALGRTQFVPVDPANSVLVANMVAQRGVDRDASGTPPIRYGALRACLNDVAAVAAEMGASVHMPRIGCGLAGGRWDMVDRILRVTLGRANVLTVVYDLPAATRSRRPRESGAFPNRAGPG